MRAQAQGGENSCWNCIIKILLSGAWQSPINPHQDSMLSEPRSSCSTLLPVPWLGLAQLGQGQGGHRQGWGGQASSLGLCLGPCHPALCLGSPECVPLSLSDLALRPWPLPLHSQALSSSEYHVESGVTPETPHPLGPACVGPGRTEQSQVVIVLGTSSPCCLPRSPQLPAHVLPFSLTPCSAVFPYSCSLSPLS